MKSALGYFSPKIMNQACETIRCTEIETSISVNVLTDNPEKAWSQIENKTKKYLLNL